jgi:phosphoribosylanthranilate isomerase
MFQIKICGVTNRVDALAAVAAGADAVGLNFYPPSPRCVERDTALDIARVLPGNVAKVGVFVNATVRVVAELADQLQLDFVQLCGDEPPDYWRLLAPRRVITVLRGGGAMFDRVSEWFAASVRLPFAPAALLVDAWEPGAFGGTGKTVDWGAVRELATSVRGCPLILAGGLGPDNVRRAIERARPAAVDVASGVERQPGRKDPELMRAFVRAARGGFTAVSADTAPTDTPRPNSD